MDKKNQDSDNLTPSIDECFKCGQLLMCSIPVTFKDGTKGLKAPTCPNCKNKNVAIEFKIEDPELCATLDRLVGVENKEE